MKFRRVCFVTGPARSGTTLLLRLLAGDPHHRNFPECGAVTSLINLYRAQSRAEKIRFEAFYGDEHGLRHVFRAQIDILLAHLLRNEDARDYLFLKDPYMLRSLEGVMDLFVQTPIVIIIRKPEDVLASRFAVAQKRGQSFDLNNQMEVLTKDMRTIGYQMRRQHGHGALSLLRYEDLVNDPDRVCDALSDRLDTNVDSSLRPSEQISDNPFATTRAKAGAPVAQESKVEAAFSSETLQTICTTMDESIKFWQRVKTMID